MPPSAAPPFVQTGRGLTMLQDVEARRCKPGIAFLVHCPACHLHNWTELLDMADEQGKMTIFLLADPASPRVAADRLGQRCDVPPCRAFCRFQHDLCRKCRSLHPAHAARCHGRIWHWPWHTSSKSRSPHQIAVTGKLNTFNTSPWTAAAAEPCNTSHCHLTQPAKVANVKLKLGVVHEWKFKSSRIDQVFFRR